MRTRPTRQTRSTVARALVTVSRHSPDSPTEPGKVLCLTLKMPAGKLREATGGRPGRRSVNVFQENPIVSGPRSSRNRKKVVEVHSSEEDEDVDDQEEDEVDDEDAPGEDDEDADADGDVDMDDAPPQPPVRRGVKPAAARGKGVKSVEAKEIELEEEEEEEDDNVSVTDSDAEGEPDDQDESAIPDVNVDDLDEEDEEDDLDEELDSDALALDGGKQTNRQRRNLGDDFLQLPMGKNPASPLQSQPPHIKELVLIVRQSPKSRST